MKPRTTTLVVLVLGLALALAALALRAAGDPPVRIGVFDSRAVAIACANSPSFQAVHARLAERMKTAKEQGDAKEIAAIEREGMLRQVMMHEQGFGKGSVAAMTALVKDSIAALAVRENLSLVVSKWEVVYSAKQIELMDVTETIAGFFGPNERVKGWLKELPKQEPVEEAYLIQD